MQQLIGARTGEWRGNRGIFLHGFVLVRELQSARFPARRE